MNQSLRMRALDGWYTPRFFGIFSALGVSRFEGESTLPPQAGNTNRWAAVEEKELLT